MSNNTSKSEGMFSQLRLKRVATLLAIVGPMVAGIYFLSAEHVKGDYEKQLLELKKKNDVYESNWSKLSPYLSKNPLRYKIDGHLVDHQNRKIIPKDSNAINREFLVAKTTPSLDYYQTTRLEHSNDTTNIGTYGCFRHFYDLAPLHIWKGKKLFESIESVLYNKIFPHISVQKIPKKRLGQKLILFSKCFTKQNNTKDDDNAPDNQFNRRLVKVLNDLDRRDMVGLYFSLTQMVRLLMVIEYPEVSWKASEVQMVNQNLISSTIIAEENIRLTIGTETKTYDEFHVRHDVIVVNADRFLYVTEIVSPGTEYTRDAEFDAIVNQWLSGFWMIND